MLAPNDIKTCIEWVQSGLTFMKWTHTVVLVCWAFGGLLPLFSNGIWHMTPIAYEILLRDVIGDALGFGIDIQVRLKRRAINLLYFLLVVAIAFNATHLGFTINELVTTDTPIYWFLIFFSCLLGFLMVLEIVEIYYFVKYKSYLGLLATDKK